MPQNPPLLPNSALAIPTTAATAYTLAEFDFFKYRLFTSGSAIALTVPAKLGRKGMFATFEQHGAGQITVAGASGVTVNPPSTLKTAAQFAVATLMKIDDTPGAEVWTLFGSISG